MSFSASHTSARPVADPPLHALGEGVALGLLTVVAFGVLMFRAANPAYWFDEHVTLAFTQESWGALVGPLWGVDTHRPWFYALQKAWIDSVGSDRGSVRALNAGLGALCVPLIYGIGRRLAGREVGWYAAVFLILSPLFVLQSRELRMYPLLNLSILVATYMLLVTIARARAGQAGGWRWVAFALAAASAFYAQATGILYPVLATFAVLLALGAGAVPVAVLRGYVGALVLYVVLILPGLWPMVFHVQTTLLEFWIPAPTLGWVYSQLAGAYPYLFWAKPIILALLLLGFWGLRRNSLALILLAVIVVGQPLVIWGLSYIKPVLIVRVIAWPTVFAAILLAVAVARLPLRLRLIAVLAVLGMQGASLPPLYPAARQQTEIDRLAPEFARFDPARDMLILGVQGFEPNLRWNHPALLGAEMRAFTHGDRHVSFEPLFRAWHVTRADAAAITVDKPRFWVLSEITPLFPIPPEDDVIGALDAVRAKGRLVTRIEEGATLLEIYDTLPPR